MAASRERAYYRAVQRAAAVVNSEVVLKDTLNAVVRGITRAMKRGASLVLLDSAGNKLVHSSWWGVPGAYLQKGLLDADRSLSDVLSGQPVTINDARQDSRIQYPELAARAGIVSILGVPLKADGVVVGSIRVYAKEHREFGVGDIDFVDTGMTLNYLLNYLRARRPASLAVCTLLDKRVRRIVDAPLDYIGFEVPDEFVVGYGLDYGEEYRDLPFIGIVGESGPASSPANL